MAANINTNLMSLTAQRNLSMSQTALATAMQRLSSGLRINSAKDDAAGLAISERFSTQIRGLNQAVRNANDGISLSQTAEGALNTVSDNLQRIRELAVQSANATNNSSDRLALDQEVQQRLAEIDRVAQQTSFNGQKILDGTFGTAAFQIGANVGESISISLGTSMRLADVGQIATATSSVDVSGLVEGSPATYAVTAASVVADYSTVPPVAGTSTIQVTTAAATTDTITINGVVFTFTDTNGGTDVTQNVVTAGAVDIQIDDMSGLNANTTAGYLEAAIDAYVASANTELDDITASVATDTVTLTYATAGLPSTNGNTITGPTGTLAVTATVDASGSDANTAANDTFTITPPGGSAFSVTLDSNITNAADLVSAITSSTGYASAGFTVDTDGTYVTFTADTPAATGSFSIGGADAATITGANYVTGTVAGVAGTPVTVAGDFSIQIGSGSAVAVADGTYNTADDLVSAINTALSGNGYASFDDTTGFITISAGDTVAVTGAVGTTTLGLPASTAVAGSLTTVNVLTVAGANDAMQRIDAALTSVNSLRATFGAIQNRFESTIANLTTTAENLTASRSRIMDADFAMETAALSRAQILQQAGTAMVAQANQMPQGVLALLR